MTMPKVSYRGDPIAMKEFQAKIKAYNKGKPREKHIRAADILQPVMKAWEPPKE